MGALVSRVVEFDVGKIGDLRSEIQGYSRAIEEVAETVGLTRRMLGLSLREVSEMTGLGAHSLRRIEIGEKDPTPDEALRLADWLMELAVAVDNPPPPEWRP